MGNRSYLYVTRHPDDPDDSREIAEANNTIPRLWHVLLAEGEVAAPIEYQRVFANAGTPNFAADVRAALARFGKLAGALQEHPLIDALPALPRHLRAVTAYLEQCVAALPGTGEAMFSANLDEYSWFYDMPNEEFVVMQQGEFNATWAAIAQAIDRQDSLALEKALGFTEEGAFENWENWCWEFGLGGFAFYHRYFRNCDDEPCAEEFADFVPQPDAWEIARENDLGLGRQRFCENGLCGVRRVDDDDQPLAVLLPPEWDALWPADERPREELWVRRGEQIGLLRLSRDGAATLLLEPCLGTVWDFSDDLAVVEMGGKVGLLDRDGRWFSPPAFDELWDYENGFACARQGELIGYLDSHGEWAIPPRFQQADNFTAEGLAPVCEGGRHGLLRTDGSYAAGAEYDALEWDDEISGWRIGRDDKLGLLHADGSPWLAAEWDEIVCPDSRAGVLSVCREAHWGVVDRQGRSCLPCIYQSLNLRTHNLDDEPPPSPAELQFAVGREPGRGLVAGDGRELIPCRFEDIDELASQWDEGRICRSRDLLLVQAAGEPARLGVWNLGTGRLEIPCLYAAIAPFYVEAGAAPWLLVVLAGDTPPEASPFGILDGMGGSLFAPEYRWLVGNHGGSTDGAIEQTRYALSRAFRANEAFLAQPLEGDEVVWLMPDGRRFAFVEKLAADHAAGDLQAAYRLGTAYRDGDGITADRELAIAWLGRAAAGNTGQPGLPEAMADLAVLLADDDNPAGHARARELFEQALARPGNWPTASARNWLGHMQLNGYGGPQDYPAAYRQFQLAAEQGNPYALYNLGLCLENGWGIEANPQQAMHKFQKAADRGVADAAHRAGLLQASLAAGKPEKKQRRELARAADNHRRELGIAGSSSIGESCLALARLLQESGVAPSHADELPEVLETGAQAGNEACRERLLSLLDNPDSPWHDPARAARWRQQESAAQEIGAPRWLPYVMLVIAVLLLYRCSGA